MILLLTQSLLTPLVTGEPTGAVAVAYVNADSGYDVTGEIGNPALPYESYYAAELALNAAYPTTPVDVVFQVDYTAALSIADSRIANGLTLSGPGVLATNIDFYAGQPCTGLVINTDVTTLNWAPNPLASEVDLGTLTGTGIISYLNINGEDADADTAAEGENEDASGSAGSPGATSTNNGDAGEPGNPGSSGGAAYGGAGAAGVDGGWAYKIHLAGTLIVNWLDGNGGDGQPGGSGGSASTNGGAGGAGGDGYWNGGFYETEAGYGGDGGAGGTATGGAGGYGGNGGNGALGTRVAAVEVIDYACNAGTGGAGGAGGSATATGGPGGLGGNGSSGPASTGDAGSNGTQTDGIAGSSGSNGTPGVITVL